MGAVAPPLFGYLWDLSDLSVRHSEGDVGGAVDVSVVLKSPIRPQKVRERLLPTNADLVSIYHSICI